MQKKGWIISGSMVLMLLLAAAAILLFKLGQQGAYNEKWADYDDYGWA
jgi:hypothetical protein